MIETTAGLVHQRGFHGTSLNEILVQSGAPRGSLYYHFPGGKEELVLEATRAGVAAITQALSDALEEAPHPADGVRAFFHAAAAELRDSGYVFGCPVAPIILDSPESTALAEVCRAAVDEWQRVLAQRLTKAAVQQRRAESLATVIVSSLEGALLLARTHRDTAPLMTVADELGSMLESMSGAPPVP